MAPARAPAATSTATLPGSELTDPARPDELEHAASSRTPPREEALRWALDTFHPAHVHRLLVPEDELGDRPHGDPDQPGGRFFYLDTDVLFPETYETKDALEERYGINFHRYSSISLEQQAGLLRRRALEPRPRRLLRDPQGRADALGAVSRRLLGLRHPPRGLAGARQGAPSSPGTSASASGS